MAITPDDKDWTWVLDRFCPECGFDPRTVVASEVADMVRDLVPRWREVLEGAQVGVRPSPDRWSPLEYGCPVRDVFLLYDDRLS